MRFLRVKDVIQMVGFSKATLYAKTRNGSFPTPIVLGPHSVAFLEAEVVAWMKARVRGGRAKPAEGPRSEKAAFARSART